MEKRTVLAIALSFIILMAFDYVYKKYYLPEEPPREEAAETAGAAPSGAAPSGAAPAVPSEPPAAGMIAPAAGMAASDTDTAAVGPNKVVVQTDLYSAVIDNRGAVLESWILHGYLSSSGGEFDMIAAGDKGETWSRPGSLYFEDDAITELANGQFYEVTVDGEPYSGGRLAPPVDVVLTLRRGDLQIRKQYSFHQENYTMNLAASFTRGGEGLRGRFFLGQDLGPIEEYIEGRRTELNATYFDSKKIQRESPPKDKQGDVTLSGNIRWIGLDMHYFTAIAIPDRPVASFDIRGYETKTDLNKDTLERSLLSIKVPVDGSLDCLLYIGPKKQSSLKAVTQYDLTGVIDYGMFSIIAMPLLSALQWIHRYVNNYGFAIILLTLILSLLLMPLRLKQMFSMKKMQAIQPQVKAIQERYKKYKKTDPKRGEMNQEVMALYKENKVNPMGGCLPLLVQFPLLIAFYSLLANSIELRQAPFIGWIQDLSAKDPNYVLPIVMGLTMFLSQKMTPMAPTADNSQAKMMQFLPIVFTFMFLTVSSGLNLYFLCSNIFQVGFQKVYELVAGEAKNGGKPKPGEK